MPPEEGNDVELDDTELQETGQEVEEQESKKVPLAAMLDERKKRQEAQAKQEELERELEELRALKAQNNNLQDRNVTVSEEQEYDEYDMSPEAIRARASEIAKREVEERMSAFEQQIQAQQQRQEQERLFGELKSKYTIFDDEDADVRFAATSMLNEAMEKAKGTIKSFADVEEIVGTVAETASRLIAGKSEQESQKEANRVDPPPPSPAANDSESIATEAQERGRKSFSDLRAEAKRKAAERRNLDRLDAQR